MLLEWLLVGGMTSRTVAGMLCVAPAAVTSGEQQEMQLVAGIH